MAKEKPFCLPRDAHRWMLQRSNTDTCRYTVAKIFRLTEIFMHAHTHLHTDTQERSPDGQADAKKIFRSTGRHIFIQTCTWTNTCVNMCTCTVHL